QAGCLPGERRLRRRSCLIERRGPARLQNRRGSVQGQSPGQCQSARTKHGAGHDRAQTVTPAANAIDLKDDAIQATFKRAMKELAETHSLLWDRLSILSDMGKYNVG